MVEGDPLKAWRQETEPYWLISDRMKVIAVEIEKRQRCPVCHVRYDDWDHDAHAYVAEEFRCKGCETLDWAKDSWKEEQPKGLYFRLVKPSMVEVVSIRPR